MTFHSCAEKRNGVDEIFFCSIEKRSIPHIGDDVIHTVCVCVSLRFYREFFSLFLLCVSDIPDDTIILFFLWTLPWKKKAIELHLPYIAYLSIYYVLSNKSV